MWGPFWTAIFIFLLAFTPLSLYMYSEIKTNHTLCCVHILALPEISELS
jgi:hypothetical protein